MCENSEEKFVVPVSKNTVMDWWVGQIIGKSVRNLGVAEVVSYRVNIIWSQKPGPDIIFTVGPLKEFDSPEEAMRYLLSKEKVNIVK